MQRQRTFTLLISNWTIKEESLLSARTRQENFNFAHFFHQYCLESLVPKIAKCVDPVPALFFISSVVLHPAVNSCSDKTLFQIELAFTEVGDLTGKLQERAILFV